MKRRKFITLLGGGVAWPLVARAQQATRSYRIAYLALLGDLDAVIVKQRLAELGYVEGKNLIFDFRSAEGQPERLPQLAVELVKTNPDLIIAGFGTATAKAAQAATATIPVVFTTVGDPIGTGIVKSLSRPGANLTGIHGQATDISIQAQEILRLKDRINDILAKHCGKSGDAVAKDTDRDRFMSADDAKNYGLVDEVVKSRKEIPGLNDGKETPKLETAKA